MKKLREFFDDALLTDPYWVAQVSLLLLGAVVYAGAVFLCK